MQKFNFFVAVFALTSSMVFSQSYAMDRSPTSETDEEQAEQAVVSEITDALGQMKIAHENNASPEDIAQVMTNLATCLQNLMSHFPNLSYVSEALKRSKFTSGELAQLKLLVNSINTTLKVLAPTNKQHSYNTDQLQHSLTEYVDEICKLLGLNRDRVVDSFSSHNQTLINRNSSIEFYRNAIVVVFLVLQFLELCYMDNLHRKAYG